MKYCLSFLMLMLTACQTSVIERHVATPSVREGLSRPTPAFPIISISGLTGPVPDISRSGELSSHFEKLVFELEDDGKDQYVRKWVDDIRYRLDTDRPIRAHVENATDILWKITGIKATISADTGGKENLTIVTRPGRNTDIHCYGTVYSRDADKVIVFTELFVGSKFPGHLLGECVLEELSQSLGPMNDVTTIRDTMWRPYELKTYDSLTWSDAVILRTLYDERIRPGMHRDVAMPIVRVIIAELLDELNR
ncbi:MAG: DUF2927 domain-containing protein [Rhodospirillales bacterium]